jgi:alanyl-tRNA synthetase
MLTSTEIRSRFLKFFESKGHAIIPSASLVPENDPTTLFTGSGMQPMVPFLLGETHPQGVRITDSQKCFRSVDIDEVGDNRHTTFFEMLGNWSLGDYFKHEQLPWMFEFLTEDIGIDPQRLYVTTFIGDEKNNIPKDIESVQIWKKLFATKGIDAQEVEIGSEENGYIVGMQGGRIFYYDVKKNWWSRAGVPTNMPVGEPGGPDSEMFYEFVDVKHDTKFGEHCHPNCDCGRFLEIGNNVFMEYKKAVDGSFEKLPQRNVDFGGGLERMAMAVNNCPDIIEINHRPLLDVIEKLSGKIYGKNKDETRAFRVIADHMKAAVFLIADGVYPSNADQGYFVRRLIRRAVRYADTLGLQESFLSELVEPVSRMYLNSYPEIRYADFAIKKTINNEEEKFRKTLREGLKQLENIAYKIENGSFTDEVKRKSLSGFEAFGLYQSYGFPIELTLEICKEKNITVDTEEYEKEMKKHQELSRSGSEQKFKGGLGSTGDMETKYHTATHLLHQALRDVLGTEVSQKGSNITSERLRFDFAFPRKMTDEEKKKVEDIVNKKISLKLPMQKIVLKKEDALKTGALHFFGDKYGDEVNVYFIGNDIETAYSKEFCGGPHVTNIGELGHFKITKEEAVSAGVRRIKAVLE